MDLAAKRRCVGGQVGVCLGRPGGSRGRHMLRLAEADTDFGFCRLFRLYAFNTALARKGLAVFNRSAHSAWPV